MSAIIKIRFEKEADLAIEAAKMMKDIGIEVEPATSTRQDPTTDIIATLGSIGAFTGLYQIICELLKKKKEGVITIERKGAKFSFSGYSLPEITEFLEEFAPPEWKDEKKPKHTKR